MRKDFRYAIQKTLGHEGGYVHDPTDRGGETHRGISRKWFPNWKGWKIIDEAKKSGGFPDILISNSELEKMVEEFYYQEFIQAINLNLINEGAIIHEVFDSAVNCGKKTAVRWLQEAFNLCNQNQKLGADLSIDGQLGPKTAEAINSFPRKRLKVLLGVLNLLQGERYLDICRKDKSQERFLHGWVSNRIRLEV